MIRSLVVEDMEAIRDINEYALGYPNSIEKTMQQFRRLTADSHHFFLGFEDEDSRSIVGYIHAEVYESLYSEAGFNLLALAVLEEFQGKGIGRQLLEAIEKEARERQFHFIRLNSGSHRKKSTCFL
ncbi:Predicted acetyltransferase [Chlamydia trachomatis]|nr:Predicted acetyltransferase [Chlamydia trachomatis]